MLKRKAKRSDSKMVVLLPKVMKIVPLLGSCKFPERKQPASYEKRGCWRGVEGDKDPVSFPPNPGNRWMDVKSSSLCRVTYRTTVSYR